MKQIIRLKKISKRFGGVKALSNVDFDLIKGEIHGLIGGNGAGKSTLLKILSGVYPPDTGTIFIEGKKILFKSPNDARQSGIEIVHQDLALVDSMNIEENLFLGRELKKGFILDRKNMNSITKEILCEMGIDIDTRVPIQTASGGERQLVALSRVRLGSPKVILYDEPTTAVSEYLRRKIQKTIKSQNEKGLSIIYVSHELNSVWNLCDRITILRKGEKVGTFKINEISISEALKYFVKSLTTENTVASCEAPKSHK